MIDLHTHSTASDGQAPPETIPALAEQVGLSLVALTDHDTTAGLGAFLDAAAGRPSLRALGGIEISAALGGHEVHILGYGLGRQVSPELDRWLANCATERAQRGQRMVEKLARLGYPIGDDEALNARAGQIIGRPHIAAAMARRGYVSSVNEAFQRFLGHDGEAYVPRPYPDATSVIALLQADKCLPALAHPTQSAMSHSDLERAIHTLRDHGLAAIEAFYPAQNREDIAFCQTVARRYGLMRCGGSDFHGADLSDSAHGARLGASRVPDTIGDALLEALERLSSTPS